MEFKKKKSLTNASDVLHRLFTESKSPLSDQFLRWQVWQNWHQIVGDQLADICCPVGYNKGVLQVWVKDSSTMQQMIFLASNMAQKVNQHVGKKWARQVRFTLDHKSVPTSQESDQALRNFLSK